MEKGEIWFADLPDRFGRQQRGKRPVAVLADAKVGLVVIAPLTLFTQDKSVELVPGAGGVPERFYIPKFHDFRSLSQANLILKHEKAPYTSKVQAASAVLRFGREGIEVDDLAVRVDALERSSLQASRGLPPLN